MAKWMEFYFNGQQVLAGGPDGAVLEVGQMVHLGLGAVELRATTAGLFLVRLSGAGRETYQTRLGRPGLYRLGPAYGHRVKPAAEEKDPILRVLRELQLPVSLLERVEGPLEIDRRWYDQRHCPNGRRTHDWVTDGTLTYEGGETLEEPYGYFEGGGVEYATVAHATWAVMTAYGRYMNGCEWERPARILVWPGCRPDDLRQALLACPGVDRPQD